MQVYKTFFKVAKKYKMSLIMYTLIIIVMLVSLNAAYKDEGEESVEMSRETLYIVDNDHSEVSERLVDYLGTIHNINDGDYSEEEIKVLIYNLRIAEYIEIPAGFGDAFLETGEVKLETLYDEAVPTGIFINMQIDEYLNSIHNYLDIGHSFDKAAEETENSLGTEFVSMQQKERKPAAAIHATFLFLPYGILSILFSGVLPVIMDFNGKERKNRTAVSSTKMTTRNIALILASATVTFFIVCLLVLFATCADFQAYIFTKTWWMAVLNVLAYTITTTLLLSMISTLPIIETEKGSTNTVSFITVIIGLSFSFLGGTFVDLEILGDGVKKIGQFVPNYWYSVACRKIWYDGAGFSDLLGCFGLQLVFGLACFAVALAFTRFFGDRSES